MNLQELLTEKCIGLIEEDSGNRICWYETTAAEAGYIDGDDEDYDCYGMSGFGFGDYAYFEANARVNVVNDDVVYLVDMQGQTHRFILYRQVKTSELE